MIIDIYIASIMCHLSLRSNTHPQLPFPLLSLQHQPFDRIAQPLFLPPQLLQS